MVVNVQSCGENKHQVKIVKIESKYSTVKANEHKNDKMLLHTVRECE